MSARFRVDCEGQGRCTLIFVHGAACDRHDWDGQRRLLAGAFRVVTLDLPGHGESEMPASATVAELARAVRRAKDEHGGGRAVLIGHSLGCRVVLEAYSQAPAHVMGLVFVDANPLASEGDESAVDAMATRIDAMGSANYLRHVFEQMFVPDSDPALRNAILERTGRWDPAFGRALLLDLCRWDARRLPPALSGVSVPLLLLQSTRRCADSQRRSLQPGMTTAWTRRVTELVPHAELQVVPGVGHFPHIEAPTFVAARISDFASRCCRDT